jgi:S-adenosylmethionine:tRNA ribosyltransferase-isomerase
VRVSDFDYDLPPELIAQKPSAKRSDSRLLCLDKKSGKIAHKYFRDLPGLLTPKDLLILNNTKVYPARLYAQKSTGGKVEILIERILEENKALALAKSSKPLKINEKLFINDNIFFEIIDRHDSLFELSLNSIIPLENVLNTFGKMPLPPYIKRQASDEDEITYQTIYAKKLGAVAAPTAGLHFDQELIGKLGKQGTETSFITLHVGLGTFQPVRVDNITEHKMHAEHADVSKETCDRIVNAKKNGGRVVAVGTTTVRALETAAKDGEIKPYAGDTNIFIYPGYKFRATDVLITNFHLPKTSLLMLVSAFAGRNLIMHAYQEAIKSKYRFYSYGDAMIIGDFGL